MLPILELIKSPAAKILGCLAMLAAAFIAGAVFNGARIHANWSQEQAETAKAVATQGNATASLAQESNRINTGVSNYVQKRTADLSDRLGGVRLTTSHHSALPGVAGSPSGAATASTGCVSVEQYNDLAWEAGNTAVMVEGWQLWYQNQKTAWDDYAKRQSEGWED